MSSLTNAPATLRRLYLTLFLRGRSSRGLNRDQAPKSIVGKLWATLLMYGLTGFIVLMNFGAETFVLSSQLHGMAMVFLALFVSASAGEVLFNDHETEILLHRPVTASQILWAKVRVLIEVSLWLSATFNLVGLFLGALGPKGHLLYFPVHLLSTSMCALFCTGFVVLIYQLCLRFFGRERLENLMTFTQVVLVVCIFALSQVGPRLMRSGADSFNLEDLPFWFLVLPPAWFAGFDTFFTGGMTLTTGILSLLAVIATIGVPWLAVVHLSSAYQSGLQQLSQHDSRQKAHGKRARPLTMSSRFTWLKVLIKDPKTLIGFNLVAIHLFRDRDTKLRFYPGVAPILVMPVVFLFPGSGGLDPLIGVAMAGSYLATVPLLALNLLQFSAHWEASDLFRYAPVSGPASLIRGAMWAVILLIAIPAMCLLALAVLLIPGASREMVMLLPGIIAMPVYAHLVTASGKAIPLARPSEEAKSANRGVSLIALMMSSFAVSGVAIAARKLNYFGTFLTFEVLVAILLCFLLGKKIESTKWPPAE